MLGHVTAAYQSPPVQPLWGEVVRHEVRAVPGAGPVGIGHREADTVRVHARPDHPVARAVTGRHLEDVGAFDAAEVVVRVIEVAPPRPVPQVGRRVDAGVPRAPEDQDPFAAPRVPVHLRITAPLGVVDLRGRLRGSAVVVDEHRVGQHREAEPAVRRPVQILLLVLADVVRRTRGECDHRTGTEARRIARIDDEASRPDGHAPRDRHHGAVMREAHAVGGRVIPPTRTVVDVRVQVVQLILPTRDDRALRIAEPGRRRGHVVDGTL